MPKIEVIHIETGDVVEVEKMHYWRNLRRTGRWELPEDYVAPVAATVEPEPVIVKRGRGRPRKEA